MIEIIEAVRKRNGETILLDGDSFKLIWDFMGGVAVFEGKGFWIYATPNFDGIKGIPFEVHDEDGLKHSDTMECEISGFEDYILKVDKMYKEYKQVKNK